MKIFVSYRQANSTYLIGCNRDRLTNVFGEQSVFRDLAEIPARADFKTILEKETNECNVVLVVIGSQWAEITNLQGNKHFFDTNDYTKIEVETGLKRLGQGKVTVNSILVMNAAITSPQELSANLHQSKFQNVLGIHNDLDFSNDVERLVRNIESLQSKAGQVISVQYFEPETLYIPEGLFWIGGKEGKGIPNHETPQHELSLLAYRLGTSPVANAQYEEFIRQIGTLVLRNIGWDGQRVLVGSENYLVTGVKWFEVMPYCLWLSKKTGRKYTLTNKTQLKKAYQGDEKSFYPRRGEFNSQRCNHGRTTVSDMDSYTSQNEYCYFALVGNVRKCVCTLWGEKRIAPDPMFAYHWKNDRHTDLNSRQVRSVVSNRSMKADNFIERQCSKWTGSG